MGESEVCGDEVVIIIARTYYGLLKDRHEDATIL